ncbi:DUF6012 family protein [Serratia sp. Se-RSBMAAmG]|uniref:DUF6012 family protein n=1 Tax=Serratia sp. Se-RSBMAAmG TaxID=3043305 RepID=UPI0024AFAB0F|nr:DUF6012 family protein [Serratia sp. Se-RSBMAAmG]MDI6976219.1 DUF6012 family protein [Serratia sp. Se-RSBMAAmG]
MYIHLVPQYFHQYAEKINLLSISVPELGFSLSGNDLATKKPFTNKCYHVGTTKGRKAMIGVLLKTDKQLDTFISVYEWDVEGFGVVKHTIVNHIQDQTDDLISQDFMLALGFGGTDKNFSPRKSADYDNIAPIYIAPVLRLTPEFYENDGSGVEKRWPSEVEISHNPIDHYVSHLHDNIKLHSMESERLANALIHAGRYPEIESAIVV